VGREEIPCLYFHRKMAKQYTKEGLKNLKEKCRKAAIFQHQCMSIQEKENINQKKSISMKKAFKENPNLLEQVKEGARLGNQILQSKNPTYIEIKMKELLDRLNIKYEMQKMILFKTINNGNYRLVDFYIPTANLIIECDGEEWHTIEENEIRNKELVNQGFNIVRFWGHEICSNIKDVQNKIISLC